MDGTASMNNHIFTRSLKKYILFMINTDVITIILFVSLITSWVPTMGITFFWDTSYSSNNGQKTQNQKYNKFLLKRRRRNTTIWLASKSKPWKLLHFCNHVFSLERSETETMKSSSLGLIISIASMRTSNCVFFQKDHFLSNRKTSPTRCREPVTST